MTVLREYWLRLRCLNMTYSGNKVPPCRKKAPNATSISLALEGTPACYGMMKSWVMA